MKRDLLKKFTIALVSISLIVSGVIYNNIFDERTVKADGTTYYVSQSTGNDSNPGTMNSPWKTLAKVSSITFSGGDQVLLKCGDTWSNDNLDLHAVGASSTNWVTLSSYGNTALGRPKILPGSNLDGAILIQNFNNSDRNCGWKITGLEVANAKLGIASIDYRASHDQNLDGLWIENCYIHDISGLVTDASWMTPYSSAIVTNAATGGQAHNITIKDVTIENCIQGIDLRWVNEFLVQNVYANHSSASALNFVTAFNGTITDCTILNSGEGGGLLGTCAVGFMHSVVNVVLRDSEIAYTVSPFHSVDGCAVDYEGASTNVTTDNCYIHDNAGRAFLVMSTAGDCYQTNITNNVCYGNGWDNDPEIEPAFLLLFNNQNNGGVISGNVIQKAYDGQYVNRVNITYSDDWPTTAFSVSNNTITTTQPTRRPGSSTPTTTATATPTPTPTGTGSTAYSWEFNTNGNTEGWTAINDISNLNANGGYLNGTITGVDPWMRSGDNLGVNISNNKIVTVRFKNSSSSTDATIFFSTTTDANFDGNKMKSFPITPNDSGYTTYTIDMSAIPTWTGTLRQFRIDPSNNYNSGSFSVDYVRIGSSSSSTATPTATPTPTVTLTPTPTTPPAGYSWEFNTNGNTEGWTAINDISNLNANGGYLNGTITGVDPWMRSGDNLGVNISNSKIVTVRFKNSSSSTDATIFFSTTTDANFDGNKMKSFPITPNDTGYTTYTIDMSTIPTWTGTLRQFRIDPSNNYNSGSFSIDYVRIGSGSTTTATPTATPTPTPTATPVPSGYAWEFNANGNNEGWFAANDVSWIYANGGYLNGEISGVDPYIISGNNLNVNLANCKTIKIRYKNSSNSDGATIFFTTTTDTNFDGNKMKAFTVTANDSGYTEYTIDMSTVSSWTGTLRSLRVDPSNNYNYGSFNIDYIRIS